MYSYLHGRRMVVRFALYFSPLSLSTLSLSFSGLWRLDRCTEGEPCSAVSLTHRKTQSYFLARSPAPFLPNEDFFLGLALSPCRSLFSHTFSLLVSLVFIAVVCFSNRHE